VFWLLVPAAHKKWAVLAPSLKVSSLPIRKGNFVGTTTFEQQFISAASIFVYYLGIVY